MTVNVLKFIVLTAIATCGASSLSAAPVKLVEQKPAAITAPDKQTILVDFGRVAFANIKLAIPKNADKPITVRFGESFKNGRIDRKPPGTVRYASVTIQPKSGEIMLIAPPANKRNTKKTNDAPGHCAK